MQDKFKSMQTCQIQRKLKPLPKHWNFYIMGSMMDFSISLWVDRCTEIHSTMIPSEYILLKYNSRKLLQEMSQAQIALHQDDISLLISNYHLEEYTYMQL